MKQPIVDEGCNVPNRGGRPDQIVDPNASSSKSVCETVNGSHRYVIEGYSLAKGMGVGKYLASDSFMVGGYQWAVYFYPEGKNPEDNSLYVSAFIALANEGTDVRALFELTLVDQSGKEKHKVHSHFDRALEGGPYTLHVSCCDSCAEGFENIEQTCPSLLSDLLVTVAVANEESTPSYRKRNGSNANLKLLDGADA